MTAKAFVYTELQNSVPFEDSPWRDINASLQDQPGLLNKTWLSGVGSGSLGGFYAFDSVENALKFAASDFPAAAAEYGLPQTTRIFDAEIVAAASQDIGSPHFGATPALNPGAFLYTEVQVSVPFEKAPWRARNPVLKEAPGLIAKTWLSGLNTNTIGGIDVFDTVENATAFAIREFPKTAAGMNAAFTTRVFDGKIVEEASRQMRSPYYV